jgi:hypothetical protein
LKAQEEFKGAVSNNSSNNNNNNKDKDDNDINAKVSPGKPVAVLD